MNIMDINYFGYKFMISSSINKDAQQLDQPDNAIVTVCASRFARSCTNRANYALQVIQMLGRPCGQLILILCENNFFPIGGLR